MRFVLTKWNKSNNSKNKYQQIKKFKIINLMLANNKVINNMQARKVKLKNKNKIFTKGEI